MLSHSGLLWSILQSGTSRAEGERQLALAPLPSTAEQERWLGCCCC